MNNDPIEITTIINKYIYLGESNNILISGNIYRIECDPGTLVPINLDYIKIQSSLIILELLYCMENNLLITLKEYRNNLIIDILKD